MIFKYHFSLTRSQEPKLQYTGSGQKFRLLAAPAPQYWSDGQASEKAKGSHQMSINGESNFALCLVGRDRGETMATPREK
jgi:hypothetical protein